jgi:hypothetical protein
MCPSEPWRPLGKYDELSCVFIVLFREASPQKEKTPRFNAGQRNCGVNFWSLALSKLFSTALLKTSTYLTDSFPAFAGNEQTIISTTKSFDKKN